MTERAKQLQFLVDEHAYLGMSNKNIGEHLREMHGVDLMERLPPPSPSASDARQRTRNTGVFEIMPGSQRERIKPDPQEVKPEEEKKTFPPFSSGKVANDEQALAMVSGRLGLNVTMTSYTETEEDKQARMIDECHQDLYLGVGQTLLDRLIRGLAQFYGTNRDPIDALMLTEVEYFIARIHSANERSLFKNEPIHRMGPDDLGGLTMQAMDMIIWPWLDGITNTENIQVDIKSANDFRRAKSKPRFDGQWERSFLDHPIYIDINGAKHGERYVSGIFCRPFIDDNGEPAFEFSAFVEWASVGFEAIIGKVYGVKNSSFVIPFSTDDVPEEVVIESYKPILSSIESLIPAAWMRYQECKRKGKSLGIPQVILGYDDSLCATKKARNKAKTHSFFNIRKVEPQGQVKKTLNSWTLNHLITVSGHYRWQPHGAGNSLMKLIWIAPYDKGAGEDLRVDPKPILTSLS